MAGLKVLLVCASVCLKKHDEVVSFPDDPCDDANVEMPDFDDGRRSISEVKCFEYVWRIREQRKDVRRTPCDRHRTHNITLAVRILVSEGTDVSNGEYAHMGALGWKAKIGTWIFKCGSSLISERFVLTAAHCSSVPSTDGTVTELQPKIVRLGCKNIMDVDRGEPAYDVNIRRFISHHRYKSPIQYYDIALVELVEEVSFRWHVHPACLWTESKNPRNGTVTGWGVIETASLKTSPKLQKADIEIIDLDRCDRLLQMRRNMRKWWGIKLHQLCAGDFAGRKNTCGGDSGGPLQTLIPLGGMRGSGLEWKLHHIVGVTSFGFGCALTETPSIYTRVASFVLWIENIVWPSNRPTY